MDKVNESLSELIKKINKNEILLPDFQRNFVWKEEEKQCGLIASVLAKMPVGSILLLNSDAKDYAYRLLGCSVRTTSEELGISGQVLALLDGQQRVTVLTNAFSDAIFELAEFKANHLASQLLKKRFFLRIPKYNSDDNSVEDFFGAKSLKIPFDDPINDEPDFMANEIYEAIKVINFNVTEKECYNPFLNPKPAKSELVSYCSSRDEYLIPLFLLTNDNTTWLSTIISRISSNIQLDIMEDFDKKETDEDRMKFVSSILTPSRIELAENPDRIFVREEFEKELKNQGDDWAAGLKSYLISCLSDIQLNQIIVDNRKRARAINIYENLNKGGISLGTFELIMAKYASVGTDNYYDKLVTNIKKKRNYPKSAYSHALQYNPVINDLIDSDDYIAGVKLHSLISDDKEMDSAYVNAFLDVMSLYSYCPDFVPEKIKVDIIKKDKILAIPAEDLRDKCDDVCDALDLALFFLQMRCGLRSIKGLNYNLILVVIAYLLINKDYRDNPRVYDYLDAWYWIVMFSGYFNYDQTEHAIKAIKMLIGVISTDDVSPLKIIKNDIFNVKNFSDEDFICQKNSEITEMYPKEFLRDVICQFYLAETYDGLFDDKIKYNPFCEFTLEKHHVIPLGSLKYPDLIIRIANEEKEVVNLRKKGEYFLNSPVNFIYINSEENLAISDLKLEDYSSRITTVASAVKLGLDVLGSTKTENECKTIIENRFKKLYAKVLEHIDLLIP